jgi:hypothetical protein
MKKYKRTNNDLQNIHIKQKIEQHEPHIKLLEQRSSDYDTLCLFYRNIINRLFVNIYVNRFINGSLKSADISYFNICLNYDTDVLIFDVEITITFPSGAPVFTPGF